MNAKEFEAVLEQVASTKENVQTLIEARQERACVHLGDACISDLQAIWDKLHKQQLEMAVAEAKPPGPTSRCHRCNVVFGGVGESFCPECVGTAPAKPTSGAPTLIDPATLPTVTEHRFAAYARRIGARLKAIDQRLGEIDRKAPEQPGLYPAVEEPPFELVDDTAAPPTEVEMRVVYTTLNRGLWEARIGDLWIAAAKGTGRRFGNMALTQSDGNDWLATLAEQLDVPLVAKWEGEKPMPSFSEEATGLR